MSASKDYKPLAVNDAQKLQENRNLDTETACHLKDAAGSTGSLTFSSSKLNKVRTESESGERNRSKMNVDRDPELINPGKPTLDDILAKLGATPTEVNPKSSNDILANLSKHTARLAIQHKQLIGGLDNTQDNNLTSKGTLPNVPATDALTVARCSSIIPTKKDEIARLREELDAAKSRIAHQDEELAQARVIKQTMDHAIGSASEADFSHRGETLEPAIGNFQNAFDAPASNFDARRDNPYAPQEDAASDVSDALSAGALNRSRNWNNMHAPFNPAFNNSGLLNLGNLGPAQRVFSNPSAGGAISSSFPSYALENHFGQNQQSVGPLAVRRASSNIGQTPVMFGQRGQVWPGLAGQAPITGKSQRFSGAPSMSLLPTIGQYQPRPIGAPLSPHASEFTASSGLTSSWNTGIPVSPATSSTYVSPLEPMNYRRLLDKTVSCDWKYIVDKIVCSNDQQASIFLQQKLKVGTNEHKFDIVEAIIGQAFPLMVNRFGNFLVQRCFEHGSPEQVVAIANAIRGNTVTLSMDPFGCHVVQKAFDTVNEDYKAMMVHELLRQIPQTVVHRYACHVWQKLFELRWSNEPPQIMAKVNEALRGIWHEVALGETGSLVVQNIFENCVEDEKRMAIEEVLASIDALARGQFGNWCIQHICEHGAPQDKSRAVEHIIINATDYSMDQFASKVVEKCLKIGGQDFMQRYLDRVTTGCGDRPRMPLIDIAGDQYGNYLIQWVLLNTTSHQRELVASHIRKHMVSLRGSKFGSRVAMLCSNPNHITRPGPGTGLQVSRYNGAGEDRYAASLAPNTKFTRNQMGGSTFR